MHLDEDSTFDAPLAPPGPTEPPPPFFATDPPPLASTNHSMKIDAAVAAGPAYNEYAVLRELERCAADGGYFYAKQIPVLVARQAAFMLRKRMEQERLEQERLQALEEERRAATPEAVFVNWMNEHHLVEEQGVASVLASLASRNSSPGALDN